MELIGRQETLAQLDALVRRLPAHGDALLLRGPSGSGRSALLAELGCRAERQGLAVLRTSGVAAESVLPYAGVHQLLQPLRAELEQLPRPRRESLRQALSLNERAQVDRFQAGAALLQLLLAAGASRPLVVLLDDAHLIDEPSLDIIAFVARRVTAAPVVLVAALDDRTPTQLDDARLPEIALAPLADADAATLLERVAPRLPGRLRAAVLTAAHGAPLALVELARAAAEAADDLLAVPAPELPLTPRLAQSLRAEAERHDERTRTALLAAALDARASLDELLTVASAVRGEHRDRVTLADISDALADGVVLVEGGRLRFGRPLSRVAFLTVAGPRLAQAVHAAFADLLPTGSTRQVLHRAAAATAADDELAAAVCAAAATLRRRGDVAAAAAALETAADLSVSSADKVHRLLSASLLALELGLPVAVRRLLDRAQRLNPPLAARPLIEWQQRLLVGEWPAPDDAESARLIDALVAYPDADAALAALMPLAIGCWWSDPSAEIRTVMRDSARRIARRSSDARVIAIAALADPDTAAPAVRERLARLAPADVDNPLEALHLAIAAEAVGAWREAHRLLGPAVEQLRRHDQAGALAHALAHQGYASLHTGDWTFCHAVADECAVLARRASRPRQALAGMLIAARAAAFVAPREAAEDALKRATAATRASGMAGADAVLRAARASIAIADGDAERVFAELIVLFPTDGAAPHPTVRAGWEILDVVEAAVMLRRPTEAARLLDGFERGALRHRGSLAEAAIVCARPLVAAEDETERLFAAALAQDLTSWPFLRARTLLALGGWQHRAKRSDAAINALRVAREELSMLGATRFVDRARRELRAAGDGPAPDPGSALRALSPHELRIARLAASGMTNAQIAEQLHVAARTVGAYLYRIFPKLGVTSRTQLATALGEAAPAGGAGGG